MSCRPIDLVLARLDGFKLRENGRDRWRACCPAHGGSNPSALSIGVGAEEQVLLRCWHGCDVEQVAHAMGIDLRDLFPPKPAAAGQGSGPITRRRLLTASQALELLDQEMTVAIIASSDLARGEALDEPTRERLLLGAARLTMLRDEVHA